MKVVYVFLFCSLMFAQDKPSDPPVHSDVLTLVDLEEVRGQMQTQIPDFVERGRQLLAQKCADCSQQFTDEWVRRMKQRMNADVLTEVVVRVYEKDLTESDVKQLIPIVKTKKAGETPNIPDDFKQRLATLFPAIEKDIVAECTQIGTKLGMQAAAEIEKEHPDWVHHSGGPQGNPPAAPSK